MTVPVRARYREATPDDVDAVRDVARTTWERDYPDVVNREAVTDTVESWYGHDQLAADVRRGDALVLVAETDDANAESDADVTGVRIRGFVHGVVDGDCGTILRAYVHPDARDDGLGRGLVDAALDAFRDRGCDRAEAMVLARNAPGNAFYDALGFEHVATDTTLVGGDGYDEHVYLTYI
ncbi:GNAT family N-acetyltransferase [Halorubellus sp. JP-L1]|uniref:GNAT family N-acetyltransferase n=1 Tax=Halorubellus sp. JP-L1 TaxID=2715753 RepID=UPI001407E50F|nr:N-acetyltransferase [Halorubellus sp. JP-L1]NHN40844.1 GNAT family N-acetyltransferase [Halorubellus sp. JP-L1]